jgi:hypothetical protein
VIARSASRVDLFTDATSHTVTAATAEGLALDPSDHLYDTDQTRGWTWGLEAHGVPPDGVQVRLRVRGDGPLPLRVVSHHPGLPHVPEFEPMPDDLTQTSFTRFPTLVARTYDIPLEVTAQ